MNLVIDLGNTNIVFGFYEGKQLMNCFRLQTDKNRSEDEYIQLFNSLIQGFNFGKLEHVLISSVVPSLNILFDDIINKLFKVPIIWLKPGVKTGLKINIDNPCELGSDLIASAVGGKTKYGNSLIIIDFGTATKLSVIDKTGAFFGCLIIPGIKLSSDALKEKASQLGEVSFLCPKKVIGKNTADSMNSGIINGSAAMIEGLVARIEEELGYNCTRIITGGLGKYIAVASKMDYLLDINLICDGLNEILLRNKI